MAPMCAVCTTLVMHSVFVGASLLVGARCSVGWNEGVQRRGDESSEGCFEGMVRKDTTRLSTKGKRDEWE